MIHGARRTTLLLLSCGLLSACTSQSPDSEEELLTQDGNVAGQELLACWSSPDPINTGVNNVRCRLSADAVLTVTEARIVVSTPNFGAGFSLTPEEPERTAYSSDSLRNLRLSVDLEVDASKVAGLGKFHQKAEIKFER